MTKTHINTNLGQAKTPEFYKYLAYSPLYNVKWMLTTLKILFGFPLKATSPFWDGFEFVSCLEYTKLFMMFCLSISPAIAVIFAVMARHFTTGVHLAVSGGASLEFWAGGSSVYVIPPLSSIAYFMSFKKCSRGIGKLCRMMESINHRQAVHHGRTELYKKAKTISQRMIILFHLFGLLIAICLPIFWYLQLRQDQRNGIPLVSEHLVPLFLFVQPFIAILGITSPIISSADFLVIYLMQHLGHNFDALKCVFKNETNKHRKALPEDHIFDLFKNQNHTALNDRIKNIKAKGTDNELTASLHPVIHVDIAVNIGLDICSAVCKFNYIFQGMIFISYTLSLILATTGLFFLVSNIFWLKGFSHGFLTLGIFLQVVIYTGRLYYLTSAGWRLNHSRKKLGLVLDKYIADTDESSYLVENADEKGLIKTRIELLQKKLSVDTPITPFDAFNLSTGAFLAASANILTYLIILLQFKMSQSGSEADRLENMAQNTGEELYF